GGRSQSLEDGSGHCPPERGAQRVVLGLEGVASNQTRRPAVDPSVYCSRLPTAVPRAWILRDTLSGISAREAEGRERPLAADKSAVGVADRSAVVTAALHG